MIAAVRVWTRVAAVVALGWAAGCSPAPADAGGTKGDAGKGGPPGGGRGGSIVLSAGDVAIVRRGPMEEGTPVTGDLRPLETVEVRARLEGDLDGVYVREGQPVRTGEVLARFEDSQQSSAEQSAQAAVASARVDLSTAQWNQSQTRELYAQGAVAEQEVKAAEQATAAAQAKLAAAVAGLRAASETQRDTRVVAPITGIVSTRSAETGEHVSRGELLFTVVRNAVLELTAAVPARQANGVVPGQLVRFQVDGEEHEGKVARVSPTIDPLSRSITVYVQMPNPDGAIKGGTFATGRVIRRVLPNALAVPAAALRQRPNTGSPFVYKIAGDHVAEADVTLGAADEAQELVEVLAGLDEGDRVIVGNVGMLGNGMRVQVLGGESQRAGQGSGAGPRGQAGAGPARIPQARESTAGAGTAPPARRSGGRGPASAPATAQLR